jgi:hypothetical protein
MYETTLPNEEATDALGRTTLPVELGICFCDQTWKRAIVFIPRDTRPCNIEKVSRALYLRLDDSVRMIEHVWVQCFGDELRNQIQ